MVQLQQVIARSFALPWIKNGHFVTVLHVLNVFCLAVMAIHVLVAK